MGAVSSWAAVCCWIPSNSFNSQNFNVGAAIIIRLDDDCCLFWLAECIIDSIWRSWTLFLSWRPACRSNLCRYQSVRVAFEDWKRMAGQRWPVAPRRPEIASLLALSWWPFRPRHLVYYAYLWPCHNPIPIPAGAFLSPHRLYQSISTSILCIRLLVQNVKCSDTCTTHKWDGVSWFNARGCSLPNRVYGFYIFKKIFGFFLGFFGIFLIFLIFADLNPQKNL